MSERYTFTSLFKKAIPLGEAGGESAVISQVVIPRIQRPYAQGRSIGESEKVRADFLGELFSVLRGESPDLDLNFIYGRVEAVKKDGVENHVMQLLDGQQRFTTLFLLHWYLLNREQVSADAGANILRALASFEYETRETSTDFCRMLGGLAANGIRFNFAKRDKDGNVCLMTPREAIKTSLDYVHAFESDPTIGSMLTMLDAMDMEYNGEDFSNFKPGTHGELWKRLDQIRFSVLSLTKYKLSEELYIKMNARGLPLSPFDCFKADFLGLMDIPVVKNRTGRLVNLQTGIDADAADENAVTYKQYFATKLDCSWCDLFWTPHDPAAYDLSYMQFFSRYFAARFLLEHQNDIHGKEWQSSKALRFFHRSYEEDGLHYHGIREFAEMVRAYGNQIDYFADIASLLNLLMERKVEILDAMKPIWGSGDFVQPDYFCDGGMRLEQMPLVVISAVVSFVHYFPACPIELFRVWMKTVNCVVENTNIDSYIPAAATAGKLADLIRGIANGKPQTVLEFYRSMAAVPRDDIAAQAVEEEIEKARRISEHEGEADSWMSLFDDVARHQFLKGMIGFYYTPEMNYDDFYNHTRLIFSLFGNDGIAEAYRDERHCLLRAIMSRIVRWSELNGRFVVESSVKKYLKNLISALNYDELRQRMHELFAVRLFGLPPGENGEANIEVINALQAAVDEAPAIAADEPWDNRETLKVLREETDFYRWSLEQDGDVHIYCQYDQAIARVPKKWSCVMLALYRYARRLADDLGMERVPADNGRDGFDADYDMYVGQDCQMFKPLLHFPQAAAYVKFYTSYQQSYPVELTVRWQGGAMDQTMESAIKVALGGNEIEVFGDDKQIRISAPWTFSADGAGENVITYEQLRVRVEEVIQINGPDVV